MRRFFIIPAVLVVLALPASVSATSNSTAAARDVRDVIVDVRDISVIDASLDNAVVNVESNTSVEVRLAADVAFAFDKSDLTPIATSELDDVVVKIKARTGKTVHIDGYTDSVGDATYNQGLSERRAAAVADAVRTRIGSDYTVVAAGHGENDPVAPNTKSDGSDNPTGRALNRRVSITF